MGYQELRAAPRRVAPFTPRTDRPAGKSGTFDNLGKDTPPPQEKNPNSYIKQVDINVLPTLDRVIGYEDTVMQLDILAEEFAATVNAKHSTNPTLIKKAKEYLDAHGHKEQPMFNVFLEGVSGTGKTTLMGAMARQIQRHLGSTKLNVWQLETGLIEQGIVGESQKALTVALNTVLTGPKPAVLIIDEADSLFATKVHGVHEVTLKLANVFKGKMMDLIRDGSIIVLMATNNIQRIDDAIKAPHRSRRVGVGLPNTETKYRMMDRVVEAVGLPCDIPPDHLESIARNLRQGKATGAHFEGLKRAIMEARTMVIKGVEMGQISVIKSVRSKGKMEPKLLAPKVLNERSNRLRAKTVEEARTRAHIESATGRGPEKFGLTIKDNGTSVTEVKMVELTKAVLDFAVGTFEGSLADDIESLANAK